MSLLMTVLMAVRALRRNAMRTALTDGVPLEEMTTRIADVLRTRHRIPPGEADDFSVRTLEELQQA
jgi:hypothetical protein